MIIIQFKGRQAIGKTTMAEQVQAILTKQKKTWRERLAWWLLKDASWNKFTISQREIKHVNQITPSAINNLEKAGVKVLLLDDGEIR